MKSHHPPLRRVLVANRAEIASRIFATCRRLGIETVAVYSDADASLPYVAEADFSVALSGSAPADTYLRGDLLVAAAVSAGADAVHPGYGFLSESADFAQAVIDAGLVWVGPRPESIAAMGSKIEAKRLMAEAGVPVLSVPESPTEADLPLLVKASAGGGGRGMRVVRSLDVLAAEIAAAEAEALSAFADGTVFCEPYVERGRHVEVQIVGSREAVLVLGDRDCSVQRRHQKVVEEAPARVSDVMRAAMHEAARDAARAIGYVGAGTVEFLVDDERGQFWFLEMNTRLQVEHPVTEAVFGLDLVELQLDIAQGHGSGDVFQQQIDLREDDPDPDQPRSHPVGHAIEVRLYAEDGDGIPQSGRLITFEVPGAITVFDSWPRHGIRVDAGYRSGDEVSPHYDAMLAKVIAWADDRETAIRLLSAALRRARIHGVTTNRDQLLAILADETFARGEATTALLSDGVEPLPGPDPAVALRSATVALIAERAGRRTTQRGVAPGWRNVTSAPHTETWQLAGTDHQIPWLPGHPHATFPDSTYAPRRIVPTEKAADTPSGVVISVGTTPPNHTSHTTTTSWRVEFTVGEDGVGSWHEVTFGGGVPGHREVYVDGPTSGLTITEVPRFADPAAQHPSGSLLAPMPGTVVKVHAAEGDQLEQGGPVLVLEAMKMQHAVTAPHAGTITDLHVTEGQQVAAGDLLAVIEATD